MTAADSENIERSIGEKPQIEAVETGAVLVTGDGVDIEDALVGRCARFDSGYVAVEIEDEYTDFLPCGAKHVWYTHEGQVESQLNDYIDVQGNVFVEW